MPTYDYRCNGCGHAFEHFQAISDKLLRKCPECGKPKLERLIGAGAGFLFKGAGFYITDYRSNSYQEGAKKESGAPAAPAAGDKAATPAKPAATVEKSGGERPAAATSNQPASNQPASNQPASSKPSPPSTPPPSSSSSKPSKKK